MTLLLCPFCGGEARLSHAGAKHIIFCPNCVRLPADGGYINQEQAIAAWNNRTDNWISVEERLPPKPEENPVFEGKPFEMYLVSFPDSDYPFRAFWDGENFGDGWKKVNVTHWMPLPEPPRGE